MSPVRILYQSCRVDEDDERLLEYVREAREYEGCSHSELYRGLEYPENTLITQLWSDQYAFADHWDEMLRKESPEPSPMLTPLTFLWKSNRERRYGMDGAEFYEHSPMALSSDGSQDWVPKDQGDRKPKIIWYTTGAVRVFILGSPAELDKNMQPILNHDYGRRTEPGCLQTEHYRGVEFPEHTANCELWASQQHFDAHQFSNRRTSKDLGPSSRFSTPGTRRHGENAVEFYKYQPFVNLYRFWYPAQGELRPESMIWPR